MEGFPKSRMSGCLGEVDAACHLGGCVAGGLVCRSAATFAWEDLGKAALKSKPLGWHRWLRKPSSICVVRVICQRT